MHTCALPTFQISYQITVLLSRQLTHVATVAAVHWLPVLTGTHFHLPGVEYMWGKIPILRKFRQPAKGD